MIENRKTLYDSWYNAITGLGTAKDKKEYTQIQRNFLLPDEILNSIWLSDGIGKRIVSVVADDMTRQWITVKNDDEEIIEKKLRKLKAEKIFNKALKWSRLYGGSIILMGINDGNILENPVNSNTIKSVDYLKVYGKPDITILSSDYELDPLNPDFGQLKYLTIQPQNGGNFRVHKSRVLVFEGELMPDDSNGDETDLYFGMSFIQSIYDQLRDFGSAIKGVSSIIEEFIITIFKFDNLAEMLMAGNEDKLRTRMNSIDLSKSLINSVLIDSTEDYSRQTASVSGLSDLLANLMMILSGVSSIPLTRLFGISPGGLNATGESDTMNYYDMVKSEQRIKLLDPLQTLIDYINTSKEFNNKVDNPIIELNPLFQMTEKEEMEINKMQAEIDEKYYNMNVLSDSEIRQNRFVSGYSHETIVETDFIENPINEGIEEV